MSRTRAQDTSTWLFRTEQGQLARDADNWWRLLIGLAKRQENALSERLSARTCVVPPDPMNNRWHHGKLPLTVWSATGVQAGAGYRSLWRARGQGRIFFGE